MKLNQRRQFAQVALFSLMALGAGSAFAQTERAAPGLPSGPSQGNITASPGAKAAIAQPNAYVKVCKQTSTSNPVGGSFTFTIDEVIPTSPGTPTRTVIVPVGGCSGVIGVAVASQIRVREQPRANTAVSSITVTGAGSLVSTNLPNRTAIVMSAPFTAVVTFVNRKPIAHPVDVNVNKEK